MTNHPDDPTARHAAAMYPDMESPKSADAPRRTATSQTATVTRGPAAQPTAPTAPWERLYAGTMAPAAAAAWTAPPHRHTHAASDFDAMFDGAHREVEPPQLSVQQVVTEQQSAEAALYPEGGQPLDSAEAYSRDALRDGFDGVLTQARHDQDTAEEAQLAEGREQAAALMDEWKVPSETACDIARELDTFNRSWMKGELPTDKDLASTRQKGEALLRKEWGAKYEANVQLARQAYQEAAKRLPWLRNLVEDTGAGNSSALIRHFATVGLKNARNRHGAGGIRK